MARHDKETVKRMLKDGRYIESCTECKSYIRFPTAGSKGRCLLRKLDLDLENCIPLCDFWKPIPDVPH